MEYSHRTGHSLPFRAQSALIYLPDRDVGLVNVAIHGRKTRPWGNQIVTTRIPHSIRTHVLWGEHGSFVVQIDRDANASH